MYDLTDFASKSRNRYPPKLYSIPFHQNYSISPPTPVAENVSISEWYMYRPKVSILGGGTSGRAVELPIHLFVTTLFHDFSEINWFVATNFSHSWCTLSWKWNTRYIWGTGSQRKILTTTRLLCNSQKFLIHTKVGLQIWFVSYELVCICILKVTNQPKGKRKHRPKESTEVKPVLAPVKIYDSSCLLPIQKELGKNYMWDLLKWWCIFFQCWNSIFQYITVYVSGSLFGSIFFV